MRLARVSLRSSCALGVLLGAAGIAACVLAALLPIPLWSKLAMVASVALGTIYHIARDALLRMPHSIVALEISPEGLIQCMTRDGDRMEAAVSGSSLVTPGLTVLNLRLPDRLFARAVVLLPDAVDADVYRRLRVWLRWGWKPGSGRG